MTRTDENPCGCRRCQDRAVAEMDRLRAQVIQRAREDREFEEASDLIDEMLRPAREARVSARLAVYALKERGE